MFKHLYKILLLAGIVLCIFQCKKENTEPDCITHEQLTNGLEESLFLPELPFYENPHFNPNNSNEIIFRFANGGVLDLIKYNLQTKEKEVLYQGFFSRYIRWGRNDWILMNIQDDLGFNIYKIRSNGQDLTRLTTSGNCLDPMWNIDGDKFIYRLGYTSPAEWILADENGSVVDTLFAGSKGGSSWQHDSLMASVNTDGLVVYNPFNPEYWRYEVEGVAQSLNGAVWLDNERVLWCHTTGIYITNVTTWSTEVIKETCNGDTYQLPTYATDIDKVIFQRMERLKKASEPKGTVRVSLYMMNPDGTEGETIQVP